MFVADRTPSITEKLSNLWFTLHFVVVRGAGTIVLNERHTLYKAWSSSYRNMPPNSENCGVTDHTDTTVIRRPLPFVHSNLVFEKRHHAAVPRHPHEVDVLPRRKPKVSRGEVKAGVYNLFCVSSMPRV